MSVQVAKTKSIYEQSAPEVQELIDTLWRKHGAQAHVKNLLQRAKRIMPKEQEQAKAISEDLAGIWKRAREDGEEVNVKQVVKLHAEHTSIVKAVRAEQKEQGCGRGARGPYNKVIRYYGDMEVGMVETIRGTKTRATKHLDPTVLARIKEAQDKK